MTQSAISQFAQDREAARKALRDIIDGVDDEGNPFLYPAQQRIAAAKELLSVDAAGNVGQEPLAMELTDEQLVDIVARALAAEKPPEGGPEVPQPQNEPPAPTAAQPSPPPPSTLAERLAGLADIGAARGGELRGDGAVAPEDDPLCL